jgi:hypothetical protein
MVPPDGLDQIAVSRGNRVGSQEKSRLTACAVSRQEPNAQGGGWTEFGRERGGLNTTPK